MMPAVQPIPAGARRYLFNMARCRRKISYPTRAKARKARREWGGVAGAMDIYRCRYCGGWHLGSRKKDG